MLRHRPHALEHVELAFRQRPDDLIDQQFFVAGERRERRAQLVRHGRQKPALRAIRRLRLIEQLGLPERERRVVGDRAEPMCLTLRER